MSIWNVLRSRSLQTARAATLRLAEVARSHGDEAQSDQILFRWIDASPTDREVLRAMQDHRLAAAKGDSEGQLYALNGRRLTIAPCGG